MNLFEIFLLDLGFSWQNSRLLPFVIILISSLVIVWLIRRHKFNKLWLNVSLKMAIVIFPLVLYFMVYPVYKGDLWDLSRNLTIKNKESVSKSSLQVYVLPNCPYCVETIELMNLFHKRNPKIKIEYVIVSASGGGKMVKTIPEYIKVIYEPNSRSIEKITQGSYPSFVMSKNKTLFIWDNNSFGLKSLDVIESAFSI